MSTSEVPEKTFTQMRDTVPTWKAVSYRGRKTSRTSAKLIAIGVKLDGPGRIPREIEKLKDELDGDFIALRVLQILVLRRLYMFRTDEADRQWLASKQFVGLQYQQSIEFKTRKTKLLPGGRR